MQLCDAVRAGFIEIQAWLWYDFSSTDSADDAHGVSASKLGQAKKWIEELNVRQKWDRRMGAADNSSWRRIKGFEIHLCCQSVALSSPQWSSD